MSSRIILFCVAVICITTKQAQTAALANSVNFEGIEEIGVHSKDDVRKLTRRAAGDQDKENDHKLSEELKKLTSLSGVKKNKIEFAVKNADKGHANDGIDVKKFEPKLTPDIGSYDNLIDGDVSRDDAGDQFLVIPVSYLKKELKINSLKDFFERSLEDAKSNEYLPHGGEWKSRELYKIPESDMENVLKSQPELTRQELVITANAESESANEVTTAATDVNPPSNEVINTIEPQKTDELDHHHAENQYNFNIDFVKLREDLEVLEEDLQDANII